MKIATELDGCDAVVGVIIAWPRLAEHFRRGCSISKVEFLIDDTDSSSEESLCECCVLEDW